MFFTPEISTEMFRYLPYYDNDIGQYHTITMLMVILYTIFVKCLFSALGKLLGNSGKTFSFTCTANFCSTTTILLQHQEHVVFQHISRKSTSKLFFFSRKVGGTVQPPGTESPTLPYPV